MLLYMALAPEQKLTCASALTTPAHSQARSPTHRFPSTHRYKEGGPAAEARFEAGMAGFEARSFRGCGVVTSEPFEVSDDNDSLQMLTRNSQVGEFYVMAPPQVKPKGENGLHTCDIMLFDEERDAHVRIGWREALNATLVRDERARISSTKYGRPRMWRAPRDEVRTLPSNVGRKAEAWAKYNEDARGRGPTPSTRTCASSWRAPSSSTPCTTSS